MSLLPINLIVSILQATALSSDPKVLANTLRTLADGIRVDVPVGDAAPVEPDLKLTTSSGTATTIDLFGASPEHLPMPSVENEPYIGTFRSQLVLFSDPTIGTVKLHFHHQPDIVAPHDHPWCHQGETANDPDANLSFEATVLRGGYTEERYTKQADGTWLRSEHTYVKGDKNRMPFSVFHKILKVEPGTVTLMVTGPRTKENKWFYLDPATGTLSDPAMNPEYIARRNAINPQLRK